MEIRIKISEPDARLWRYYLRRRYSRSRMGLPNLVSLALREIVVDQAAKELDAIDGDAAMKKGGSGAGT